MRPKDQDKTIQGSQLLTKQKQKTQETYIFKKKQQKMEPCSMGGDAAAGTSATTVKSCGISRTF